MSSTLDEPETSHLDQHETSRLDELRARLRRQADLFDDPGAYLAGVEDALDRLGRADRAPHAPVGVRPSDFHVIVEGQPASRSDRARYLAALAIGLSTAGRSHREIIREVVDAADGATDLLQQAARSVYALRVGDAEHRRTAEAILLQCVIETKP
ncbi:MAG: hypothetical protein R3320_08200 [Nitriliruptorales bacterium]|nr:hypothetical protein [Nitriliruptorales bacterium]